MTAEESTALMTRAVKLGITITDILFETAEERREDLFLILQRKRIDLTTVKLGVIGFAVNDAVSTADERRINLTAFVQDDDGNAKGGRLNSPRSSLPAFASSAVMTALETSVKLALSKSMTSRSHSKAERQASVAAT